MNLKIIPMFTKESIQKEIDKMMKATLKLTLSELNRVGLEFVTSARQKAKSDGGFDDQTGNLRSSIGFIVVYDGKIVHENFALSDDGTERHEGLQRGRSFANKVGEESPVGYALILVAGMEYASFVEAKGYDVITGSTLGTYSKMQEVWKNVSNALKEI